MINKIAFAEIKKFKERGLWLIIMSLLATLAMIGQAWFFASFIDALFLQEQAPSDVLVLIGAFILCVCIRLGATYIQENSAIALASLTKASLRQALLMKMFGQGIQQEGSQGQTLHLFTDGLNQVESYIAKYIPQLLYTLMIPLIMGIVMVFTLPWLGLIILLTVPCIPVFMILIGKQAESMNKEQWEKMSFLSGHFLDILQGLTTLKVFGRAKEQLQVIGRLSSDFKDSTLKVLRVAFVSAFVLELVATISTALMAVYMGLRLLDGTMTYLDALFVLLLAPEFYSPFRQLGAAFHTGMAGGQSLEKIDHYLQEPEFERPSGSITSWSSIKGIRIQNLSFSYDGKHKVLEDINLAVPQGQAHMLVGQSGAGKTTLLKLLCGFMSSTVGSIEVELVFNSHRSEWVDLRELDIDFWQKEIIYVSQTPHIFEGTLRDNICFGLSVSEEELDQALLKAEAKEFVQDYGGLDSLVGEGGVGLSGGQKQRIALARAFLRKGSILFLDEATAHLDVKTEKSLRRGIQRLMKDKVVLLVGHRLQTMSWAYSLSVMKHGRIIEQGTYKELWQRNGYFKELIEAGNGQFSLSYLEDSFFKSPEENAYKMRETYKNEASNTYEVVTDDRKQNSSYWQGWKLLLSVLAPAKWSLLGAIIFSVLTVFMNVALLSTSAWLLAAAALQPDIGYLSLSIVGVRFFGISRAICRYFERLISHRMAFQGLYGLRMWFYKTLEPLGPAIFKSYGSGDLLGRVMSDIELLQFFYLRVLIPPVGLIMITGLVMAYVSQFSWTLLALVIVVLVIGAILIPLFVLRHNRQALSAMTSSQGQVKAKMIEVLAGMGDILIYGQKKAVMSRIIKAFQKVDTYYDSIAVGNNKGNIAFLGLMQVTILAGAYLSSMVLQGKEELIYVSVVAIGLQAWFEALQPMTHAFMHAYESKVAVQGLLELDKNTNSVNTLTLQKGLDLQAAYASCPYGQVLIDCHEIDFAYDRQVIYKDFSLQVKKGEALAIVGPSGSGKTSLFNILERFYDFEGSLFLLDKDLKTIPIEELRSLYTLVSQETYIFHASLEENIRLAKPYASDGEIESALIFAGLVELVEKLPEHLKTVVGQGGLSLSGGEKQRVALARMYLRNTPILLLDEPFEGLDQLTRRQLQESLFEFMKEKTVLYITHHLEGLEHMDQILFMENGHIVESGSYRDLIDKPGYFHEYCRLSMARI